MVESLEVRFFVFCIYILLRVQGSGSVVAVHENTGRHQKF